MTASLSRYLKDFSAPKVDLARLSPSYFPEMETPLSSDAVFSAKPPPEPRIDIEAERQSAYGRGRAHAEAELTSRHDDEVAELMAAHAVELAALRRHLEEEAAATIHRRFSEMGSALATLLGEQTAHVLAPVMTQALTDKAVTDLAAAVRQAIDGEGVRITVRGPTGLFEALKEGLAGEEIAFRHVETADIDLTVEFGDSILMTRLSAWADTVRKVIA